MTKPVKKKAEERGGTGQRVTRGNRSCGPGVGGDTGQSRSLHKPADGKHFKTNPTNGSLEASEAAGLKSSPETCPGMSVEESQKFVSISTGLTVVSVCSSIRRTTLRYPDRALIVKMIPEVVLINSCGRCDSDGDRTDILMLGVDMSPEQLLTQLGKVQEQEESQSLVFSLVDVSSEDPFSFLSGCSLLPMVDKTGFYQLLVKVDPRAKRALANLTKNFDVFKTVEGEGETIFLVSHVLELILFSECVGKEYTVEKRHSWKSKQRGKFQNNNAGGVNRFFRVKVNDDQFNQLSPAVKQFNLNAHLKQFGKVLQLEQNSFGVPNNFLVVFSGNEKIDISGAESGSGDMSLMELFPDTIPDFYIPNYGVDQHGFYSLAGKFPGGVSLGVRTKFKESMEEIGAVGFRVGETEDHFTLHFVTSRSIEQLSRFPQYSHFILKIESSLLRPPRRTQTPPLRQEKKVVKMIPSVLKLKEIQSKATSPKPSNIPKVATDGTESRDLQELAEEEKKVIQKSDEHNNVTEKFDEQNNITEKSDDQDNVSEKSEEEDKVSEKSSEKSNENNVEQLENSDEDTLRKEEEVKPSSFGSRPGAKESSRKSSKPAVPCFLTEAELLNINWQQGKTLVNSLKSLGKFLLSVGVSDVEWQKDSIDEVVFKIVDKKKFIKVLKIYSRNETNSFDKLRSASQSLVISGNKANKGMFGLTITKKNCLKEAIKTIKNNYPGCKIEDRSQVRIIWLQNKLDYFKVLTDKTLNLNFVPSIQNYTEVNNKKSPVIPDEEVVYNSKPAPVKVKEGPKEAKETKTEEKRFQDLKLTEKEIFGFIWRNLAEDLRIREEQVVSRQLTEFIRNVKCSEITNNEEDGLVFHFSRKKDFNAVLSKYCPELIGHKEKFVSITRKFTMIPSRGNYGIFSVKRVRQSDFFKFGSFKHHNNTLWFDDKLDVIAALRDPTIAKLYPSIYIDCRNIIILQNIRPLAQPASVRAKTKNSNTNFAKGFSSSPVMRFRFPAPRRASGQLRDPAIIRSGGAGHRQALPRFKCTSLLSQLLPSNINYSAYHKAGTFNFDFMSGKFGVLPSNRVIKNGYKMYKSPYITRRALNTSLFLEDREQYRNKKIEEAAEDIKSILNGCDSRLTESLKEIKMRRVELFLRERLGVEKTGASQQKEDVFLSLVEGDLEDSSKTIEDVTEDEDVAKGDNDVSDILAPDMRGFYTLSVPFDDEDAELSIKLEEDIAWYEAPVSLLPIVDPIAGRSVLEVKMKTKEVVMAAYVALKHKYPGLKIVKTVDLQDIIPDQVTGLYTVAFNNKKELRYHGVLEKFIQFCSTPDIPPLIKRGDVPHLVLVGYREKEDALNCLQNVEEVTLAPGSRS